MSGHRNIHEAVESVMKQFERYEDQSYYLYVSKEVWYEQFLPEIVQAVETVVNERPLTWMQRNTPSLAIMAKAVDASFEDHKCPTTVKNLMKRIIKQLSILEELTGNSEEVSGLKVDILKMIGEMR